MSTFNCNQCQQHLFDFHEGRIDAHLGVLVDDHLKDCDGCAALLNDIWQMNLITTRWQDETPSATGIAKAHQPRQWTQLFATAASLLALIMVLTDTHIVASDSELTLKMGRSGYVSASSLEALKLAQNEKIETSLNRITAQQLASNQLMMRAMLETSRAERRDEMAMLVTYWDSTQTQQIQQTREDLQYLIMSQAEDDKDIKQLNNALQVISLQRGSDL